MYVDDLFVLAHDIPVVDSPIICSTQLVAVGRPPPCDAVRVTNTGVRDPVFGRPLDFLGHLALNGRLDLVLKFLSDTAGSPDLEELEGDLGSTPALRLGAGPKCRTVALDIDGRHADPNGLR